MKLFLDDLRDAPEGWCRCYCIDELIHAFEDKNCHIEAISLDHDLGDSCPSYMGTFRADTGYDFCLWLIQQPAEKWPKIIRLHTANSVGKDNMRQLLTHYAPPGVTIL